MPSIHLFDALAAGGAPAQCVTTNGALTGQHPATHFPSEEQICHHYNHATHNNGDGNGDDDDNPTSVNFEMARLKGQSHFAVPPPCVRQQ